MINKWKIAGLIVILVVTLLVASQALAMASTHYRLDWFTPMTSSGGGTSSSAHFAANVTVGQTVVGASSSPHFGSGLGYWYGLLVNGIRNYLPVVMKK